MKFDTLSTESLHMSRSESVSELSSELHGLAGLATLRPRSSLGKESEVTPPKTYGGLGKSLTSFLTIIF